MFNGANAGFALCYHCATRRVYYVLGNSLDNRFAFKVDSLYFIAVVFGGRIEGYSETESCMQSLAKQ